MAKTVLKPTAAVFCLMLACAQLQAASPAKEPDRLPLATLLGTDISTTPTAPEAGSVKDLTSQTVVPCAMTLFAENPKLAKEAPKPGVPGTFSVKEPSSSGSTPPLAPPASAPTSSTESKSGMTYSPTSNFEATCAAVSPTSGSPCGNTSGGCCDNSCNNECCEVFKCCKCGPDGNFWIRDEYVGWWAQGGRVPALVNTSSDGQLPSDITLYGNDTYNGGYRSGNWAQAGMWFDCCHTHGIQADYFFAGQESSPFFAASDGNPILTRPFIDASTGEPADQLVAFPGIVVGRISIDNHNSLQGAGALLRCNMCCDCGCDCCGNSGCSPKCWRDECCSRCDFVGGFRWYQFNDNLNITENLVSIDPTSPIAVGTMIDLTDSFTTENNFYGFEFGVIHQRWRGRWMTEGTYKVALGDMNSVVNINGMTTVSFPGQPTVVNQGGLLALSSNIGRHSQDNFAAIPQVSLRLGYRLTEHITVMGGYTFMYFQQIARAGDQIDPVINTNLIPPVTGGGTRPAYNFHPSDLVLQGATIGAEINF